MKWVKEHFFMSFIFSANYKAQTLKHTKRNPILLSQRKEKKLKKKYRLFFSKFFNKLKKTFAESYFH